MPNLLRKALEAKRILDAERKLKRLMREPTITPRTLPVELMELTIDEANSGEYDDWLDREAQRFTSAPDFTPGTQWDD